jgi:hypothetical protein
MSSSSSISSFEPTPEERAPRSRIPWAALAFLAIVPVVELAIHYHQPWFADLAAWQWETKHRMLDNGELDGDVAVIGSSILFHGLDPTAANDALSVRGKVVNLALNGQTLQHSAQLLERYVERNPRLRLVVLELWNLKVEHESWLRGPYFRAWATPDEFLQSGVQYWEPSTLLPFVANRVLPSFRYREALDNWIFACAGSRGLDAQTLERNLAVAEEMKSTLGFARSTHEEEVLHAGQVPAARARPWEMEPAAELWLNRFLETCARHRLRVVLFLPPAPPFVERDRATAGYATGFARQVEELRTRFPAVALDMLTLPPYDLRDFTDDHHYSREGRQRLSRDFAGWLTTYHTTQLQAAAAQNHRSASEPSVLTTR